MVAAAGEISTVKKQSIDKIKTLKPAHERTGLRLIGLINTSITNRLASTRLLLFGELYVGIVCDILAQVNCRLGNPHADSVGQIDVKNRDIFDL